MAMVASFALLFVVAAPALFPGERPAGTVSGGGEATYRLVPDGEGFVHRDRRIEARVAPDGAVSFKRRGGSRSFFPLPLAHPPGTPTLQGSLRRALGKGRKQRPPEADQPAVAPDYPFARQPCDRREPCFREPTLLPTNVAGSLDLTEVMMRTFTSDDPDRYQKARFLSATFDFRARMAARDRARRSREATGALPRQLEELWRDPRFSVTERRRILCTLWGEMDPALPEGRAAGETIMGFVKKHAPEGSAGAYTKAELDGCTAATGRTFAPYGP